MFGEMPPVVVLQFPRPSRSERHFLRELNKYCAAHGENTSWVFNNVRLWIVGISQCNVIVELFTNICKLETNPCFRVCT